MRKSIQIKLAQQAQRKNTYFSLVFAICTLSILFFVDVFKTLEFLAFMPFAYLIFINLSIFMKKSDQDKINKEPPFLIYISIIASLIIANLYLFTNYSNFKSINALTATQFNTAKTVAEGKIHVNKYTVGSGRNSSIYTDIELLNPQGHPQLKIKCDFFDTKEACPELIKFDQQIAKIKYFAEYPYFSLQEALLLNLETETTTWSYTELTQYYQKQKYASYFYLFMILIANILILRTYILGSKANS